MDLTKVTPAVAPPSREALEQLVAFWRTINNRNCPVGGDCCHQECADQLKALLAVPPPPDVTFGSTTVPSDEGHGPAPSGAPAWMQSEQRREEIFRWFFCPIDGCSYRTGTSGPRDAQARNALALHLQRKKHGLSRDLAKEMSCLPDPQSAGLAVPPPPKLAYLQFAENVIQRVAELPDRTSPDDWPEAMLVTEDELDAILRSELRVLAVPPPQEAPHTEEIHDDQAARVEPLSLKSEDGIYRDQPTGVVTAAKRPE